MHFTCLFFIKTVVFVVTLSDVSKDNEQSNFQILYEDTTPIHYSHLHLYEPEYEYTIIQMIFDIIFNLVHFQSFNVVVIIFLLTF